MPATLPPPTEPVKAPEKAPEPQQILSDTPVIQQGDPDPATAKRFAINEPGLEQKLAELRQKIATKNVEDIKASDLIKAEVVPDAKVEVKTEPKQDSAISADASDADLDKHIKENSNGLTPTQLQSFKKLTYETRAQKRELSAKLAELEAAQTKLKELESRPPQKDESAVQAVQKELEAARKRVEEQEKELGASRIEATEQFRKEIGEPLAQAEAGFKEVAAEYELNPEDILKASSLRGKARAAAMAELTLEMPDYDKTKFFALVDNHTELNRKASELRANAKQNYDAMLQAEREKRDVAIAQRNSERAAALPKVWEENIVKSAPFLKEVEGDADWNARLQQSKAYAEQAEFEAEPVTTQVEIMQRAAVYPLIVGQVQKLEAEIARLKNHNAALKGAQPSPGNGSIAGAPAKEPGADADKGDTLEARFKRFRTSQGIG